MCKRLQNLKQELAAAACRMLSFRLVKGQNMSGFSSGVPALRSSLFSTPPDAVVSDGTALRHNYKVKYSWTV